MTKTIDVGRHLYEVVQAYPEVVAIMVELGFKEIKAPGMLQTAGRYMTIEKGAKLKKIPLEQVIAAFQAAGFEIGK
ncbi:DUF1858 domain-containing protein [Enterococcus asini]|uniref:DUF1858 domain-containing protein n=1 Tax=Enterococcus asini TaxID=57732 RepID=UPI00288E146C|nr:DUF1858 domain-containing protein [Enterococcus asini]MDT2745084.1 DUF1858 domain-containing protein [Enterococcus asini]